MNDVLKMIKQLEQEKCELLGIIQEKDEVIATLNSRIEKMKCCENCNKRFVSGIEHCIKIEAGKVAKYDKWELAECV